MLLVTVSMTHDESLPFGTTISTPFFKDALKISRFALGFDFTVTRSAGTEWFDRSCSIAARSDEVNGANLKDCR